MTAKIDANIRFNKCNETGVKEIVQENFTDAILEPVNAMDEVGNTAYVGCDFSRATIEHFHFIDCTFTNCKFHHFDFGGGSFSDCVFDTCDFDHATSSADTYFGGNTFKNSTGEGLIELRGYSQRKDTGICLPQHPTAIIDLGHQETLFMVIENPDEVFYEYAEEIERIQESLVTGKITPFDQLIMLFVICAHTQDYTLMREQSSYNAKALPYIACEFGKVLANDTEE